jgi:CRP-like cAMP-binding protein
MIRIACGLALVVLALLILMLFRTEASTAILFSFVGHSGLGLAIAILVWHLWRPVHLSPEAAALRELRFDSLKPRDFAQLLALGEWRNAAAGEAVYRDGEASHEVHVLASGSVSVTSEGRSIGTLRPGQMVGTSQLFRTGEDSVEAVATERTRYVSWRVDALRRALALKPSLRAALQAIVIDDLSSKLRTVGKSVGR